MYLGGLNPRRLVSALERMRSRDKEVLNAGPSGSGDEDVTSRRALSSQPGIVVV